MLFDGSMVNGMICVRKQGTRFLLRKILIALRSTKLSMLGNSMRPYMSKARISSKVGSFGFSKGRCFFVVQKLIQANNLTLGGHGVILD